MMKKAVLAITAGVLMAGQAWAGDDLRDRIENRLKSVLGPEAAVSDVYSVGKDMLYEVQMTDGGMLHVTPDLNFFVYDNETYEITPAGPRNITAMRLGLERAKAMADVKDADTVIFRAKGEQKAVINVFTDIDCGYCQKLHREVGQLNDLGITVRYLAFPRSGIADPNGQPTDSFRKINSVWCQADRTTAMTAMKTLQGELSQAYGRVRNENRPAERERAIADFEKVRAKVDDMMNGKQCSSPVAAQYNLGKRLGVNGTPAILTEDGTLIPGYMEADALAQRLGIL